jgi:copper chaperone CopZ
METIKFKLLGLHCEACVKLSTIKLKNLKGIKEVKIDLASGNAEVMADRTMAISEIENVFKGTDYSIIKP